jgi:hypothetical protein
VEYSAKSIGKKDSALKGSCNKSKDEATFQRADGDRVVVLEVLGTLCSEIRGVRRHVGNALIFGRVRVACTPHKLIQQGEVALSLDV